MADAPPRPDPTTLPEAEVKPKARGLQLVWLVPLVAALIGGWLAVKSILEQGPTITIVFKSADGLEAGKTKLKYKNVEIGQVTAVTLSKDLKTVFATAELVKDFKPHLVEDTTFWVVRPRISGGNVTGLGTILSGAYIGVAAGKSTTESRAFTGLEEPPVIQVDTPGTQYTLHSGDLGSIDIGSPIFFRRLEVGQVISYQLDEDGNGVSLRLFVNAPYDKYVTENTRFWNASGVDVKLDSSGISVQTQSVVSILFGGVAFETPSESAGWSQAKDGTPFELFVDRTAAMRNPERDVLKVLLTFDESVRGLAPGAAVDFRGIAIGEVTAIKIELDQEHHKVLMPVEVNLYPDRLRQRSLGATPKKLTAEQRYRFLEGMVAKGMRAQMRTGNLLTGQLYVALDFFPRAPKASIKREGEYVELPTMAGSLEALQTSLKAIADKLERLPLDQISNDLRQTLQSANALLSRFDTQVAPEATATLVEVRKAMAAAQGMMANDAPLQQDTREAIRELARTAKAFRTLADYLERHPEALLRGKQEDDK
jgi:paraquat-inducible protein B